MAFRGFGDDALKVKADKREAALKAAQIAASERASMRAANVQMAGLQENARQADMANQLAREQLAAGNERFDKQLAAGEAARMDELALKREGMAADEAYRRDSLAATEAARKADLSVKIAEMSQKERQLQLNESTAARLDAEWQRQQAAQEEMQSVDTALQLAILRFAVNNPDGQVPMGFLNALNNHRGVAYGDPGSVTQVFGITDPTTKARVGTGMIKIGDDGKPIESILDPMLIIPKVLASMPTDKAMETIRNLTFGNQARGSDRVTAAAMKYARENRLEFAKSDPASLVKTLAEQEDTLRVTKPAKTGAGKAADPANQENLDRVRRIKTKVLKEMEAQLGGVEEEATPAANLTPEQRAFVTKPGTDAGAAPAGQSPKVEAVLDKGELVVTINGQTARMPDTPKNRATLQKKYGIQIGGETRSAPAKSDTPVAPVAGSAKAKPVTVETPAESGLAEEPADAPPVTEPPATGADKKWKTSSLEKPLIETDMNAQKSGSIKVPEVVSSQFSKQQEESLTEEDKKAISEILAASWGQKDPKTGLPIDPKEYSKQKIREYFKQKKEKDDADFNRLFGKFLK